MKRSYSIIHIAFCALLAIVMIAGCFFVSNVSAASDASLKLTLSANEVRENTEFKLTLTYTSSVDSAYVSFRFEYDNSKVTFISGDNVSQAAGIISEQVDFSQGQNSRSFTRQYTFKSKAVGTCNFTITDQMALRLIPEQGKDDIMDVAITNATLGISNKEKSSNCYLKFIEPSVGTLNPKFNKETLTYTVNVANNVDVCYMYFGLEDSSAKSALSGTEFLKVGNNVRTITVTAENGNEKVYSVNVIRAKAPDPVTPTPTPTPSPTPTPTPSPDASETPDASENPSESPAITPEITEKPTETPTVTTSVAPEDTTAPTPTPGLDGDGDLFVMEYDNIAGNTFTFYDVDKYLARVYPEKRFEKATTFVYTPAGETIETLFITGIRAYRGKDTQFLVYGSKNGGAKQLYILDIVDNSLQRYSGGDKLFDALDVLIPEEATSKPTETSFPGVSNGYVNKYAFSEGVDRTIAFSSEHKVLVCAVIILVFVVPLMILAIALVAHNSKKSGKQL